MKTLNSVERITATLSCNPNKFLWAIELCMNIFKSLSSWEICSPFQILLNVFKAALISENISSRDGTTHRYRFVYLKANFRSSEFQKSLSMWRSSCIYLNHYRIRLPFLISAHSRTSHKAENWSKITGMVLFQIMFFWPKIKLKKRTVEKFR